MDQVTLAKNQMRAENWCTLISACQQKRTDRCQLVSGNRNCPVRNFPYRFRKPNRLCSSNGK